MLVRRAVAGVFLAFAASSAGACGDATGEPIYASSLSGPGDGGDGNGPDGDDGNDRHCPDLVPEDDSRCPLRDDTFCSYGGGAVECECDKDEWHCRYSCPPDPPQPWEARCENREGMQCRYEDVLCFCTEQATWTCFPGPKTCPDAPPAPGSFCEPAGTLCPYGGFSCLCDRGNWRC